MSQRYPVFIDGQRYGPDFQTKDEYKKGWQSVLRAAHGANRGIKAVGCGCPSQLPRPLYIRTRGDQFHLACWPGMGSNHAKDCRYYSFDVQRSGLQAYAEGVIQQSNNGMLDIKLAHGATQDGQQQLHNLVVSGSRYRQAAMSIHGLLHLIWQEAELSVWHPAMEGKRNFWVVSEYTSRAADRIGNAKGNLGQVLVAPADKGSKRADRNNEVLATAYAKKRRVYILGVLARYRDDQDSGLPESPRFAKPFGYPRLFLSDTLLEQLNERYEREIQSWQGGERVVMLVQAQVQQSKKTGRLYCRAEGAGMMMVSPQWIPAMSIDELALERSMREAGRAFEKPMRFDSVDEVFPDFWMLDMGEPYPMEIWDCASTIGQAKRSAKTDYYNKEFPDGWWQWDAAAGDAVPELPQKKGDQT
mgnify:CR=1 FL=1